MNKNPPRVTKYVDLPCGCQDVYYDDGCVDREHDHVECDGLPNPILVEWEASLPTYTQEELRERQIIPRSDD